MEIVIVGGGYAAIACATRLAQRAQGRARIRLVNPQPVLVERIRLHQAATGQALRERRIDKVLQRAGVELVLGRVAAIDPLARTATLERGDVLRWDRLVVAIGSQAGSFDVPGAAEHAAGLEPHSAGAIAARLRALPPAARVVVVGGGLTGIEAAGEIAEAHPSLDVHLVSRGPVADGFSPAGREHVQGTLAQRLRVTLHEHVAVDAVDDGTLVTDNGELPFDLCVWAAGFRLPQLPWDSGLRVNALGQVLVDAHLRSVSHPHVYAAGDIAAFATAPRQAVPMGCKTALPTGAHAGENLAHELHGEAPVPFDYALSFFCVSLGRHDGLIQWAGEDGRLTGRVLTGGRAALFKETICRMTWWSLAWEARGRKAVVWKRGGTPLRAREPVTS